MKNCHMNYGDKVGIALFVIVLILTSGCAVSYPSKFEIVSLSLVNANTQAELSREKIPLLPEEKIKVKGIHGYLVRYSEEKGIMATISKESMKNYYDSFSEYIDKIDNIPYFPILKLEFSADVNLSEYVTEKSYTLSHGSFVCGTENIRQDLALYPVFSMGIKLSFPLKANLELDSNDKYIYYAFFRLKGNLNGKEYDLLESDNNLCFQVRSATYGKVVKSNVIVIKNNTIKELVKETKKDWENSEVGIPGIPGTVHLIESAKNSGDSSLN